jgi:predicted DNA-binding transcriptional regulator AlpA
MTSDLSNACPDRLLKLPQVCDMIGRSRASIYRDVATKAFPEPLKVGGSSRWLLSEV